MKKTIKRIITAVVFIVFLCVLLSFVFNWTGWYRNSPVLSVEDNKDIKEIVIQEVRNHYIERGEGKWLFIMDLGFMESFEKIEEDHFYVSVQTYWPNDWVYYFTFLYEDGKYTFLDFEIDP